nr:hypothetical protein [Pedobacter schmidteae]
MIETKNELIARYLMPAFNLEKQNQQELFTQLCQAFRLHHTIKF